MWSETKPNLPSSTRQKLAELRMRTDADLAALLRRAIERSFHALDRGDYSEAEAGCAKLDVLLPLLPSLRSGEFRTLWSKLDALRAELNKAAAAPCS